MARLFQKTSLFNKTGWHWYSFFLTFAVATGELKLEIEQRFYQDDLPAHVYFYETPISMTHYCASCSGTNVSLTPVSFNYNIE